MSGSETPAAWTAQQPALMAFIDDRIDKGPSRALAREMAGRLLEAYGAFGLSPREPLGVVELERAEATRHQVRADDPVHGWIAELPLAGDSRQRRQVSSLLQALTGALEARRRGAAEPAAPRTESARRPSVKRDRAAG